MPLIECRLKSQALILDTSVRVILPDLPDKNTCTLYLLHGLSDDESAWCRRTSIERYVQDLNLAVVMPAGGRSYYQDMRYGDAYWTYISKELPERIKAMFKLPATRSRTFAAGLSMGGYGAFRLALSHPERFAAAASLSGAVNIAPSAGKNPGSDLSPVLENAFGVEGPRKGSRSDLLHLASKLVKSGTPIPKLLQFCGTGDFLLEQNRAFQKHASKIGLPLDYIEDSGSHEWGYWDAHIQKVLDWLPLPGQRS